MTTEDQLELEKLDAKLRAILPTQYRDTYEDVLPVSMGSAALKYGADGLVAWDQIWAKFCDLAMAGGPPHRGTLLEPASAEAVAAEPVKYQQVVDEIGRGVGMITGLSAQPSATPGWIGFRCSSLGMAAWLVRAIVMENILARHDAEMLYLPAGPDYRLAKEIKNVITTAAKTCHYWMGHMPLEQQQAIDGAMRDSALHSELLEPASPTDVQRDPDAYREVIATLSRDIGNGMGLLCFPHRYVGWFGVECSSEKTAVWMMRAMAVDDILVRREGSVLFLPVHPGTERGARLIRSLANARRLHSYRITPVCPSE